MGLELPNYKAVILVVICDAASFIFGDEVSNCIQCSMVASRSFIPLAFFNPLLLCILLVLILTKRAPLILLFVIPLILSFGRLRWRPMPSSDYVHRREKKVPGFYNRLLLDRWLWDS